VTGITQSDRVAAGSLHPGIAKFYERGSHDHCKDVKTFARHRMEERDRIVAWLLKNARLNPHMPEAQALVILFSKAIEDGAHLEEQDK
jgi:hypothetical protein